MAQKQECGTQWMQASFGSARHRLGPSAAAAGLPKSPKCDGPSRGGPGTLQLASSVTPTHLPGYQCSSAYIPWPEYEPHTGSTARPTAWRDTRPPHGLSMAHHSFVSRCNYSQTRKRVGHGPYTPFLLTPAITPSLRGVSGPLSETHDGRGTPPRQQ